MKLPGLVVLRDDPDFVEQPVWWRMHLNDKTMYPWKSTPVIADDAVFVADDHARVRRHHAGDGAIEWRYDSLVAPEKGIVQQLQYADGSLVFGCYDGTVTRLDAASGEIIWRWRQDSSIHATPELDLARNRLFHGEQVRAAKLAEAQDYLAKGESRPTYPLLQAVAVARNIALLQAARLVVAKAEETMAVLTETERFREQIGQAIAQASDEKALWELREWPLDRIYPELTQRFKFRVEHIEPPDLEAPIGDAHRAHEIARLKAQLREAINVKRKPLQSDYLGNEEMRRHKAMLAQSYLEYGGKRDGVNYGALEAYAEARALPLAEAAQLLLNSFGAGRELLTQTERVKDQMLARIDAVKTLNDIRVVEKMLEELNS